MYADQNMRRATRQDRKEKDHREKGDEKEF